MIILLIIIIVTTIITIVIVIIAIVREEHKIVDIIKINCNWPLSSTLGDCGILESFHLMKFKTTFRITSTVTCLEQTPLSRTPASVSSRCNIYFVVLSVQCDLYTGRVFSMHKNGIIITYVNRSQVTNLVVFNAVRASSCVAD